MQKEQYENLLTITAIVSRQSGHAPVLVARNLAKLQRIAVSLRKRYEAACSYQWADNDAYRARTASLQQKAVMLGQEIGLDIKHQEDPRGAPLSFTLRGGEHRIF